MKQDMRYSMLPIMFPYVRSSLVPVANIGSQLGLPMALFGFVFQSGFMLQLGIMLLVWQCCFNW